jgi:hypothetical protein
MFVLLLYLHCYLKYQHIQYRSKNYVFIYKYLLQKKTLHPKSLLLEQQLQTRATLTVYRRMLPVTPPPVPLQVLEQELQVVVEAMKEEEEVEENVRFPDLTVARKTRRIWR